MDLGSAVVLGIVIFTLFFFVGYVLERISKKKYNFDVFGWSIILRGVVGLFIIVFGLALAPTDYGKNLFDSPGSMIIVFSGSSMILYNFIYTARKTNIFLALGVFVYQLISILLIMNIVLTIAGAGSKK